MPRAPVIIDAHSDILLDVATQDFSLADDLEPGRIPGECTGLYSLPKWERASMTVSFCAIFTASSDANMEPGKPEADQMALHRALRMIAALQKDLRQHPNRLIQVRGTDDIDRAASLKRIGVMLTLEGADPLGVDLDVLEVFYALGIRAIGLTWDNRNAFADGRLASKVPGGLSALGMALVERMDELGILIDLAHLSPIGMDQVLAATRNPVILSHVRPIGGYVDKSYFQAIAKQNGVIGVIFYRMKSLDELVQQIEYLTALVGEAHVGLGSDFWGVTNSPADLSNIACLPRLTLALEKRGWSRSALNLLVGGNWYRIIAEVVGP